MLYLGLLFGVVAGNVAAHRTAMNAPRVYLATLILIISALVGARLLFVATNWDSYRLNPRRIWNRKEGGSSMYGGFLLALLTSVPLLRALRVEFGAFWDVASFTILVAMIFTRVGCLLNGCCYGRRSESGFAVFLPDINGVWDRRLPTQIMEAITGAVLLIFAAVCWGAMRFAGELFLLVTLGYSSARLAMEFAREPQRKRRGLRFEHALSTAAISSCLCALMFYWQK
jgi:phosphatidylglycerol---prolipoprotein diacylglyceryl transferase